MPMATNALEWLQRCPPVAARHDRTRASIAEKLERGDVLDDGSILTASGLVLAHGEIWLTERHARAAAYYGWRESAKNYGSARDSHTGEPLFVMVR